MYSIGKHNWTSKVRSYHLEKVEKLALTYEAWVEIVKLSISRVEDKSTFHLWGNENYMRQMEGNFF